MNLSTIQSVFTVIMFLLFLGIVVWAWSSRRKDAFEAAAQLPFAQDPKPQYERGPE
jgi:cytochrome c oxidase cbb3-type subunit IV